MAEDPVKRRAYRVLHDAEDPVKPLVPLLTTSNEEAQSDVVVVPMDLPSEQPTSLGGSLKYISLLFLVAQNSSIAMLMRYSRTQPSKNEYLSSTAVRLLNHMPKAHPMVQVVCSEAVRLFAVLGILGYTGLQTGDFDLQEISKSVIPAVLWVAANNLAFVAVTNLDALSWNKWISLVLLGAGIVLVQSGPQTHQTNRDGLPLTRPLTGLLAAVTGCGCSSLAGVYFEKILKDSPVSLWARNVHLAAAGVVSGLVGMQLSGDVETVRANGFFNGYTPVTWTVILMLSFGGLISAVVIKYADNILKGFATSFALILTCLLSALFFDFVITLRFLVGAGIVNFAIVMYTQDWGPAS